jgi:hypothetical protein
MSLKPRISPAEEPAISAASHLSVNMTGMQLDYWLKTNERQKVGFIDQGESAKPRRPNLSPRPNRRLGA